MIERRIQSVFDALPSFFAEYCDDKAVLDTLYAVLAMAARQLEADARGLVDMLGVATIPVHRTEHVVAATVREADVRTFTGELYGDAGLYGEGGVYGEGAHTFYAVRLPRRKVVDCAAVSNTLLAKGVFLIRGDFVLRGDTVYFLQDPFQLFDATVRESGGGSVVDIFYHNVVTDPEYVFKQAGTLLGPRVPSSRAYRDFVVAAMGAMRGGATLAGLQDMAYAMAGGGKAVGGETVEDAGTEDGAPVVVTDKRVYRIE